MGALRVNSFVEALINMVCELIVITPWFKILYTHSMVIRHSAKELLAKNGVTNLRGRLNKE